MHVFSFNDNIKNEIIMFYFYLLILKTKIKILKKFYKIVLFNNK